MRMKSGGGPLFAFGQDLCLTGFSRLHEEAPSSAGRGPVQCILNNLVPVVKRPVNNVNYFLGKSPSSANRIRIASRDTLNDGANSAASCSARAAM